jgi:hypothetical protein
MKQLITVEDISRLTGRFIIQVNTDNPVFLNEVKKESLPFYFEKRVKMVATSPYNRKDETKILVVGLYGDSCEYTKEKFVDYFNEYLGDSKGERFHRLLTQKEMDVVNGFIKSRQY